MRRVRTNAEYLRAVERDGDDTRHDEMMKIIEELDPEQLEDIVVPEQFISRTLAQ